MVIGETRVHGSIVEDYDITKVRFFNETFFDWDDYRVSSRMAVKKFLSRFKDVEELSCGSDNYGKYHAIMKEVKDFKFTGKEIPVTITIFGIKYEER